METSSENAISEVMPVRTMCNPDTCRQMEAKGIHTHTHLEICGEYYITGSLDDPERHWIIPTGTVISFRQTAAGWEPFPAYSLPPA